MKLYAQIILILSLVLTGFSCKSSSDNNRRIKRGSNNSSPIDYTDGSGSSRQVPRGISESLPKKFDEVFPLRDKSQNQVAFLERGAQFLKARIDLFRMAKSEILLQTFIWSEDESSAFIADELITAHERGVKVTIVVDSKINVGFKTQALFARMESAGIKVVGYQPAYLNYSDIITQMGAYLDFFSENNYRNHEKMIAIDPNSASNAYGIVGGVNIGNEYFRIQPKEYLDNWTDQDVLIKGSVVSDIAEFIKRNAIDYEIENPRSSSGFDNLISIIQGKFGNIDRSPEAMAEIEEILATPHILDQVNFGSSSARMIVNRPKKGETYIHEAYMHFIQEAKSEILISNSYYIPNADVINALADATARGVQVRILTNSIDASDFSQVVVASHMTMKQLFENPKTNKANLRIFEWAGHPTKNNDEGINHSKYAVFDGQLSIIGSYNIDPRSNNLNSESVLIFDGDVAIEELRAWYYECISDIYSSEVTPEIAEDYNDPDDFSGKLNKFFVQKIIPVL